MGRSYLAARRRLKVIIWGCFKDVNNNLRKIREVEGNLGDFEEEQTNKIKTQITGPLFAQKNNKY